MANGTLIGMRPPLLHLPLSKRHIVQGMCRPAHGDSRSLEMDYSFTYGVENGSSDARETIPHLEVRSS